MFDSKTHQYAFFSAIALIALACYWGKKNGAPEAARQEQDFSYEMPRPSSYSADFDISGRPIIRKTETIKNTTVTRMAPPPAVAAATTNAARPSEAAAKKAAEEQKKKIAEAKKAEEVRRAKATVNIAKGSSEDAHMGRLADSSGGSNSSGNAGIAAAYSPPMPTADTIQAANGNQDSTPKLTASQWQSLLMAQPTSTNGAQFLSAYKSKSVDSATFYNIASMLLKDSAKDRQTLGFNLLQQTPSLKSFTILVDTSSTIQDSGLKTQANQVIASYGSPSQFAVLAQALYSTDANVVSTAAELINMALSTESSQGQGSSSGSSATPQQFQIFIPGLRQLASSSDPSVASQAQALLNSIQTLLHA